MMIDAEMYGMMPSANTGSAQRPPENMLNGSDAALLASTALHLLARSTRTGCRTEPEHDQREQQKTSRRPQVAELAALGQLIRLVAIACLLSSQATLTARGLDRRLGAGVAEALSAT